MSNNLLELWRQMGTLAQSVVVVLFAMSIYSLTVAAERLLSYRRARRQSLAFAARAKHLDEGSCVQDLISSARKFSKSHLAKVVSAGLTEFERKSHVERLSSEEVLESTRHATERATSLATAEFKRGIGGLATIGATAPFVGLFGTVIGIINAFDKMAKNKAGGIEVVSQGIAEALITTAFGLLVALPAVWLYNYLIQNVEQFQVEMNNSASELVDRLLEVVPARSAGKTQ